MAPTAADRAARAAEPARAALGSATGAERFTQSRIERILTLVVALGCGVLGAQAFLGALGSTQESPGWHRALMIAGFLPLALLLVALVFGVMVQAAGRLFPIVFLAVLACWPAATAGIAADPSHEPWIWYLLNVATAAAVMGYGLALQIVFAVAVPAAYAAVRLVQLGPAADAVVAVVLDAVFALILGGVIITLGWLLRAVAVGIDRARADAVASYAAAADADAAEAERVAVAALMHDSVLAALIAAERATTPREETLAVAMAREALTRLANAEQDAGEGSDEPVPPDSLVRGIQRAVAALGVESVAARVDAAAPPVPGRVARAIVLATTQAVTNALQHADGAGLSVAAQADARRVVVRVGDTGPGFDPGQVAEDRLGIRGSIVARMAAAGGKGSVRTGPGGTVVALEWERPR